MKLNKKAINALEDADFAVTEQKYSNGMTYLISRFSPAGQDFNFEVREQKSKTDYVDAFYEAYENYDVSEETILWVDSSGHGKNGAPYELEDVLADMKVCEGYILEAYNIVKAVLL